jgi:hypothetical protein
MRPTMTILVPSLCCSAHVRYIAISLPRIDYLVAELPGKYVLPESPSAQVTHTGHLPDKTGPNVRPPPPRRGRRSHAEAR